MAEAFSSHTMEQLRKIARARKFECLYAACPVYDRCPNHHRYPSVEKDVWIVRNCPKFREAVETEVGRS